MADTPAPSGGGGKKLLGQPMWIWAAGAVALIGGFIYLRSKASASAATQAADTTGQATGTYQSPTGLSWEQFLLYLHDQQGSGGTTTSTTTAGSPAPPPVSAPKVFPVNKPAAKTGSSQPPLLSGTYKVKPGDTLASLAKKFGISRVELAHGNGLGTGAGLKTGQVLKVPGPLKTRAQGGAG